ncbi:MAG: hypothetical protein ACQERU_08895 [Bacteroidota bacterium]
MYDEATHAFDTEDSVGTSAFLFLKAGLLYVVEELMNETMGRASLKLKSGEIETGTVQQTLYNQLKKII